MSHLSLADLEGEGLSPVPGGVDLLAVGEGQDVVTGDLLPLGGEGGAVALLHGVDVHAHGDADDDLGGGGVEKRASGVGVGLEEERDKQAASKAKAEIFRVPA